MAEKEGFGTLRCECRLGGIQQVSTGHLHLNVQISPSYFRQKEKGLLENSPYQHSSQCHPALATKSIKKRLQPG